MLLITCPVCGQEADETEFHPGGEAHLVRPATANPADVSPDAMHDYLYVRKNPRGVAAELWLCERGCGKWFNAKRDTVSQTFTAFYPIDVPAPVKPPAKPKASAKPAKAKSGGAKKTGGANKTGGAKKS